MTYSPITCSQCDAGVRTTTAQNGFVNCGFCGTSVRVNNFSPQKAQTAKINPSIIKTADDSSPPLEYARLKRPNPSASLEAPGGGFVFGLVWSIFSAIFLIIGVGLFINQSLTYNSLQREGVSITATITALQTIDNEDYLVHYQFKAPVNGGMNSFEDIGSVSYELYSTLKVKQPVEILYVISDPSISAIKAEFGPPATLVSLGFAGMGGLFLLVGAGILYGAVRGMYYLRLLRSKGCAARGYLFDGWQDKDSDGDPTYFVAYAFKTSAGKLVSHAEQNTRLYETYQIGDTFEVRYLQDNPSICQPQKRG